MSPETPDSPRPELELVVCLDGQPIHFARLLPGGANAPAPNVPSPERPANFDFGLPLPRSEPARLIVSLYSAPTGSMSTSMRLYGPPGTGPFESVAAVVETSLHLPTGGSHTIGTNYHMIDEPPCESWTGNGDDHRTDEADGPPDEPRFVG